MLCDTICNNSSFHQESLAHVRLRFFQIAHQEPSIPMHTRSTSMNILSNSSISSIAMLHWGVLHCVQ